MAIGRTTGSGHPSGLTRRQRCEHLHAALLTERATFDSHYQELAQYYMPRRTRFWRSDRNKGDKRNGSIIDSSPTFAARTLQSGMHAGLTSPARPWFKLTTPDPDLAQQQAVKEWLHTLTQRMATIFLRSNLYQALPVLYGDMGVFGTGCMAWVQDDDDLLRGYSYPVGSYALGMDHRGIATTFAREYQLTVRQLVQCFGPTEPGSRDIDWSRFSLQVKDLWNRGEYEQAIDVTWIVMPNELYDRFALDARRRHKWASIHFEAGRDDRDYPDGGGVLRESGFASFPVFAPRWDTTGEDVYGTSSPGMVALGDTKQLQFMQKRKAKAIEKAIDPPLKAPFALRGQKTSLLPGDLTYVEDPTGHGLTPIHEVSLAGLEHLVLDMSETRERIWQAFYADLFLMLARSDGRRGSQPVTAREIDERHEEKLLALGPVLERTNDELLDPLIDRTFEVMLDAGLLPEIPAELEGVELKVEYLSIMAQAQKLVGVIGQDRFVQSVLAMAPLMPEVLHKVDAHQIVDEYGVMLGVSPKIVRTDEDAAARLQAAQEAAAAAQQAQTLKTQGQAAQAMAAAPVNGGGSMLDAMVQASRPEPVDPRIAGVAA